MNNMGKEGNSTSSLKAYVQAYFSNLDHSKKAEKIHVELNQLKELVNISVAQAGSGDPSQSDRATQESLQQAVKYLSKDTLEFLAGLDEKVTTEGILTSIEEFNAIYENKEKFVNVTLTSAVTLSEDQKLRILKKFQTKIGEATIFVKQIVDPDVVGGVRLESENHYFDNTIVTTLKEMKKHILQD